MAKVKNRWFIAACAVALHISIGSIYAWSQIAVSITQEFPWVWDLKQITLTFSIAIICLGLTSAFLGHFVERKGPRISGIIAAFFFSSGLLGASFAIQYESLILLYLSYGVLCGIGMGLGYLTPVSTLLKWFPERRGLAMGMAIMGFGFGAALEVFLLQHFLPSLGIHTIASGLLALSGIYFILMFSAALYLAPPPLRIGKQIWQR